MEDKARECLALKHLGQIENPQVAFSVRQRQPITSLVEAVSATIEMESYLQPKPSHVAQVEPEQGTDSVIAAIQHQQRALTSALDKMMERLEKLKAKSLDHPKVAASSPSQAGRRVVVCRKCHCQGHYDQGDPELLRLSLLLVTHSYQLSG